MQLTELIGQIIEFTQDGFLDDDRLEGRVLRVEDGVAIVVDSDGVEYRVSLSQVTGTGMYD